MSKAKRVSVEIPPGETRKIGMQLIGNCCDSPVVVSVVEDGRYLRVNVTTSGEAIITAIPVYGRDD